MTDIVDELRKQARGIIPATLELQTKAADEIERLRLENKVLLYTLSCAGLSPDAPGKSVAADNEQG